MYCVNVMYPNPPGSTFDNAHYLRVHLPMGVGLLHKHLGIKPIRIDIELDGWGVDGTPASAPFHCLCKIYFNTKEEANGFIKVFGIKEAADILKADWPKYTPADPVAVIAPVRSYDVEDVIRQSVKVIEDATAELKQVAQ